MDTQDSTDEGTFGFRCETSPTGGIPDRFEARNAIGLGGMGRVLEGLDRQNGQRVIMKGIPISRSIGSALAKWQHLKESLSRLNHPAIIPILAVYESEGWLWIVKPLVEGQTLSRLLPMDPRKAAALIAELAEALHLAHQQGLVHGSISSATILIGADGHPHWLEPGELRIGLTGAEGFGVLGAVAYLAPELAGGAQDPPEPRVEVYALGVVLYEILTNQRPYSGNPIEILTQAVAGKARAPRRIVPSIPAPLEAICLKAMAVDPGDRYATAGELASALRDFLRPSRRPGFWK